MGCRSHKAQSRQSGTAAIGCIGSMVPSMEIAVDVAVNNGNHVEPVAPAHRVLHHVQAGAQPGRHLMASQVLRQTVLWQHRPVGQMPGNTRSPVVQHQFTHPAPQAIGTDQHIAFDFEAFGGLQGHDPSTVLVRSQPVTQRQPHRPVSLKWVQQQGMQIRPVNGGVGGPVEPDRTLAERQYAQLSAGYCIAHLQTMGKSSDPCKVPFQTHAM